MKSNHEVHGIRLWVDGYRSAPEGWVWVKTLDEAKKVLENAVVGRLSLQWPGTSTPGMDFIVWMSQNRLWPSQKPDLHGFSAIEGYHLSKLIDALFPSKEQKAPVVEPAIQPDQLEDSLYDPAWAFRGVM